MSYKAPDGPPPPRYPSSPPPVHTGPADVAPYQQNAQMTSWDQPPTQYNPGWQNQPPPGGYYGPQPYPNPQQQQMYYQQQPGYGPGPGYGYGAPGYFADDRGYGYGPPGRGGMGAEGICAGLLGALACCCCLDFLI